MLIWFESCDGSLKFPVKSGIHGQQVGPKPSWDHRKFWILGPDKDKKTRTDQSVDPYLKLNKTYQISRPAKAPIAVGSDVIVVKLRDDKAGFLINDS